MYDDALIDAPFLDSDELEVMDRLSFSIGQNWPGAGIEKEWTIRQLRGMVANGHRPDPRVVERCLVEVHHKSPKAARKVREFYERILRDGGRFVDHARRPI